MQEQKWYVLYVKRNHEKKVAKQISNWHKDIEAFCPVRTEIRVWSDRNKKIKTPLLPGIIFINTTEQNRTLVFDIPGTLKYLYDQGKPGIVRVTEINFLKNDLKNLDIQSHDVEELQPGNKLPLTDFGMTNQEGLITKVTKNNIWITLKSAGFVVKLHLR